MLSGAHKFCARSMIKVRPNMFALHQQNRKLPVIPQSTAIYGHDIVN